MKLYTTPEDRQIATLRAQLAERDERLKREAEATDAAGKAAYRLSKKLAASEARVGVAEILLIALIDQFGRRCDGERRIDAPGHSHSEPGIWDSDNGELAGKLCDKCALWRKACAAADAALSQPGKGE